MISAIVFFKYYTTILQRDLNVFSILNNNAYINSEIIELAT